MYRFDAFGTEHLLWVAVAVGGAIGAVLLGRRHGRLVGPRPDGPVAEPPGNMPGVDRHLRFRRVFAVLIVALAVPLKGWKLTPGEFGVGSLPLHLSDFAWPVAAWALWSANRYACGLIYFWGLTLVVQSILTPSLDRPFPDPRYLAYWSLHLLMLWAASYLVIGRRRSPGWRQYAATLAVTAGWAAVASVVNAVFDTNFGYLKRKPSGGSMLDLLGPWPVYLLVEAALVALVWALMTWPWVRGSAVDPHAARRHEE